MGLWSEYEFIRGFHYVCPVEKALQVNYTVPHHVILKPLTFDNLTDLKDHLPSPPSTSINYLQQIVAFLPSIGAFDRETGELMAWIVTYYNECHSALRVKEKYRRMGLARLLCQKLMKDRALEGKASHSHIVCGNVASENLFLDLGFEVDTEIWFGGKIGMNI